MISEAITATTYAAIPIISGRGTPNQIAVSLLSESTRHHTHAAIDSNSNTTANPRYRSSRFHLIVTFIWVSARRTPSGSAIDDAFGAVSGINSPALADANAGPANAAVSVCNASRKQYSIAISIKWGNVSQNSRHGYTTFRSVKRATLGHDAQDVPCEAIVAELSFWQLIRGQ